jgi:hypothetical protein
MFKQEKGVQNSPATTRSVRLLLKSQDVCVGLFPAEILYEKCFHAARDRTTKPDTLRQYGDRSRLKWKTTGD